MMTPLKTPIVIELLPNEFITLEYRSGVPYIRWVREGVLVVDRMPYGAEEKLLRVMENYKII